MPALRLLLCAFLTLTCATVGFSEPQKNHAERSVFFLWPGQAPDAARFDLSQPLVTDRPSFTNSSRTVGQGVTQVELGYAYTYEGGSDPHAASHRYPDLSVRHGLLADWFEVRLKQSLTTLDSLQASSTGFNDLELETRVGLTAQHRYLPEIAITQTLSLPTGSRDLRVDRYLPGVGASYSWSLPRSFSLAGSTVFNRLEDSVSGALYDYWATSLLAARALNGSTSVFLEGYGLFPSGRTDSYFINTGVLSLLSTEIQIDLRVGSRIDQGFAEEFFCGVGLGVRFR